MALFPWFIHFPGVPFNNHIRYSRYSSKPWVVHCVQLPHADHDCNPSIDAFHLPLTFSLQLLYCMYVIRSAKVKILMNNNLYLMLLLDPPLWDRTKMKCIVMRTSVIFSMSFGWTMSSPKICFVQVLVMVQLECSCIFVIRTCSPSPHAGGLSRGVPFKNGVLLSIVRFLSAWRDSLLDDHLFIKPPVKEVT